MLHLSADAPIATVVVRLTDVAPDGTSAQVSAGILNLTHRHSDTNPEPLVPGRVEEVRVPLRTAGYRWLAGHRIRVSVATQSWPVIWPSPLPVTLSIHRGGATPSRLVLPVVPAAVIEAAARAVLPHDPGPPPDLREVGGGTDEPPRWRIEEDVIGRSVTVHVEEWGTTELEDGRSLYSGERLAMTAWDDDPARARLHSDVVYRWREHAFETEIRATGETTSDATTFFFDLKLEVDLDGSRFFEREWHERSRATSSDAGPSGSSSSRLSYKGAGMPKTARAVFVPRRCIAMVSAPPGAPPPETFHRSRAHGGPGRASGSLHRRPRCGAGSHGSGGRAPCVSEGAGSPLETGWRRVAWRWISPTSTRGGATAGMSHRQIAGPPGRGRLASGAFFGRRSPRSPRYGSRESRAVGPSRPT